VIDLRYHGGREIRPANDGTPRHEAGCRISAAGVGENGLGAIAEAGNNQLPQFPKKGNEMQYNFNMGVEDSIASARRELTRMTLTDPQERESVKRVSDYLDEGASALKIRQKHSKVADRSRARSTITNLTPSPMMKMTRSTSVDPRRRRNTTTRNLRKQGRGGVTHILHLRPGSNSKSRVQVLKRRIVNGQTALRVRSQQEI